MTFLLTFSLLFAALVFLQTGRPMPSQSQVTRQPNAPSAFTLPTIPGSAPAKNPQQVANTLADILLLLTVLTLAPALLIMTTAFTRIVIVLSFLRSALGTQSILRRPRSCSACPSF